MSSDAAQPENSAQVGVIMAGEPLETPEEYTKRLYDSCNRRYGQLQMIRDRYDLLAPDEPVDWAWVAKEMRDMAAEFLNE